jgi:hypothetical protein
MEQEQDKSKQADRDQVLRETLNARLSAESTPSGPRNPVVAHYAELEAKAKDLYEASHGHRVGAAYNAATMVDKVVERAAEIPSARRVLAAAAAEQAQRTPDVPNVPRPLRDEKTEDLAAGLRVAALRESREPQEATRAHAAQIERELLLRRVEIAAEKRPLSELTPEMSGRIERRADERESLKGSAMLQRMEQSAAINSPPKPEKDKSRHAEHELER